MSTSTAGTRAGAAHDGTQQRGRARGASDRSRWYRLLQPAMYPYDPALLIGGAVKVDPEISDMNDLARLIELCTSPPFMTYPVLNREPSLASAVGNYWRDNVATWSDAAPTVLNMPEKWTTWYNQFRFREGLVVAPLKITLNAGTADELSIWNYLIIDRAQGMSYVDRLDPHSADKPDLDTALTAFAAANLKGFAYRSPKATAATYRRLVRDTVFSLECPEFVRYNVWAYWLLYARLCFSDYTQEDVYENIADAFEGDIAAANCVLNFYGTFTASGVLHAFHDELFLMKYPSRNDLWRFEPAIMDRVYEATTGQLRTSQINQVIGAALRDYLDLNAGADYSALYKKYMGVEPTYVPKPQSSGGWIPLDQVDAELRAILTGRELKLGYITGKPYVFLDAQSKPTGFNVEMMAEMLKAINTFYAALTDRKLAVTWVDACPQSAQPPCTQPTEEVDKFAMLYKGLEAGDYHVAFCGQLMLTGSNVPAGMTPEWAVPTGMIFTAVCYTGKDYGELKPDWSRMASHDREGFVRYVADELLHDHAVELTFFSVINPGPSPGSAQDLVAAINNARAADARGCAVWVNGSVSATETLIAKQRYHFMVGDSIANGYMFATLKPEHGTYLNIAAVQNPSLDYDAAVRGNTLLAIAPFTIRRR